MMSGDRDIFGRFLLEAGHCEEPFLWIKPLCDPVQFSSVQFFKMGDRGG
jgi:hypothetical protein